MVVVYYCVMLVIVLSVFIARGYDQYLCETAENLMIILLERVWLFYSLLIGAYNMSGLVVVAVASRRSELVISKKI